MAGGFLKCDAQDCAHREECPDYGPEMIGKPCPKCGANLLTQEDFDAYEPIRELLESMASLGLVTDDPSEGTVGLRVNQHDGKLKIEIDTNKGGR